MVKKVTEKKDKCWIFNETLKNLIDHHSISYNKLSKYTGITRVHLMGLAKGKYSNPKLNTLDKVASFFKVSHAQMVGEKEINFKKRPKDFAFDLGED
jgi:transcriptional regulator with XRE-family HTH domain